MPDVSNSFVILLGLATVFFGLICIIVLSYVMSAICRSGSKQPGILRKNSSRCSALSATNILK